MNVYWKGIDKSLFDATESKPREKHWLATYNSQSCPSPDMSWINFMDIFCPNSKLSGITACFNFLKVTWKLVLLKVFDLDRICFYCAEALLICLV